MNSELSNRFSNMGLVCACLVVAYHVGICGDYLTSGWWVRKLFSEVIGCVGVPYFFWASGWFLAGHVSENGWWRNELAKRVRSLLIPFLVWNMLFAFFMISLWLLSDYVAGRNIGSSFPTSFRAWCGCFGLDPSSSPILGPLWFVRSLLILVLCSPFLKIAVDKMGMWFIGLCFVAYVIVYSFRVVADPFCNGLLHRALSLQGVCFFSAGMYMRMNQVHYKLNRCLCWCVLLSSVGVFLGLYVFRIAVNQGDWAAFFIPFLVVSLWGIVPSSPQPHFIAGMAFPIFLMHCFVLEILAYSSRFIAFLPPCTRYLTVWFCGIVGPVCVACLIRKLLPRAYSVIMGGR